MGGGLMQLVAYGAQDVYLTGNPQITFFKVVYRRHTNFSMEAIEQTLNGTIGLGNKVSCTVSRNGDLVHRCYLQVSLGGVAVASEWGHMLLKSVEVEIGGQRIDRHTSEWLQVWNELTQEAGKKEGYKKMIGKLGSDANRVLYVPLQFWFCRNPGLALPLIALQYHEVKINVEFASQAEMGSGVALNGASLFVDYIYLDTDERRRFAQISHEYLIEQLQFTGGETLNDSDNKVKLNFNHPVKCLIWTLKEGNNFDFVEHGECRLQLNGHERFSTRDGTYFSRVQPYQHMPNVPTDAPIHMYSFGLKPAEHQPSGTCNMSRIDNATLHIKKLAANSDAKTLNVYAVNYNVLRIMSGMGGLAYSN